MSLVNAFAHNLRLQRAHRKLSQGQLAADAGLSVSYISMLERGQRSPPLDTLAVLAEALGISPLELLAGAAKSTTRGLHRTPSTPRHDEGTA